jgi:hypothetical protein
VPQPPESAQRHYRNRRALTNAASADARRRWNLIDPANISGSWTRQSAALTVTVSGAQAAAVTSADPYVQATLATQGTPSTAEYAVAAMALAGVTADGRDLRSLLFQPAITSLMAIKDGQDTDRSLAVGLSQLDTIVRTEVADAGRTADQIATTTHGADGYVRLTVGPTCNRCLILAGRWYRFSRGFERHPNCDCVMVPAGEGDEPLTNPEAIYRDLSPDERTKAGWSQAEQKAIDLGADIIAVTNIHRKGSLYTAGGRQFAREAAGKRPRITPRQIFIEAGDNRAEAIRLLKLHRYIR